MESKLLERNKEKKEPYLKAFRLVNVSGQTDVIALEISVARDEAMPPLPRSTLRRVKNRKTHTYTYMDRKHRLASGDDSQVFHLSGVLVRRNHCLPCLIKDKMS